MNQANDSKKRKKWKYLSERERYNIELLLKEGYSVKAIAANLDRDRRTIEREIKRGTVSKKIERLELKYGDTFIETFKTITIDNGNEFLDYEGLESSILNPGEKRTTCYYAHPYSSWERGSNENANKLIRRHILKGANIGKYSDAKIKDIENWINNYPRKLHEYRTANDMYKKCRKTLIIRLLYNFIQEKASMSLAIIKYRQYYLQLITYILMSKIPLKKFSV